MSFDPARLARLQRALDLHTAWRESRPRPPLEDWLAEHAELADLLRPLATDAETGAEPAAEDGLDPGSTLGDFVIEHELGRGAMGVVYAARQRGLGRSVALKVLPAHARLAPQAVARFRRESALLAGLDHPGLVDVITVGRDRGHEFFAMGRIDGAPLNRILRRLAGERPGDLAGSSIAEAVGDTAAGGDATAARDASTVFRSDYLRTVAGLLAQVADALHHAHETGVLHRDVKPSNILVTPAGRAVLTDFGLARREAAPSMTHTGDFAGTPYYVAPEQVVASPSALDGRADVFSLGATLYEAITLERPFRGASSHEVVAAILTAEPIDPRRIDARIPVDLVAITRRALEKRPADRYPTAKDLAEDLLAFVERRPVRARPLAWHARLRRRARRHPATTALIAVLAVSVPALTALGGYVVARRPVIAAGEAQLRAQRLEAAIQTGTMLLELHDHAGADAAFATAARVAPDDPRPPVFRALGLQRRGHDTDSRAVLAAATERGILSPRVAAIAAGEALGPAAAEAIAAGSAVDVGLQRLVAGVVRLERAHAAADTDGFADARDLLERAALLAPDTSLLALTQLAHALGHLDDGAAARRVAEALDVRGADSGPALYWAAFALRQVDLDAALERLERAAAVMPERAGHLWFTGGHWLERARRRAAAEDWLERAVRADPDHAEAWANLAGLRRTGRDFPAALAAVERAIALDPDRALFHANRAGYLLDSGETEAAEQALARALALDPAQPIAISNWAVLLARGGRADDLLVFYSEQHAAGRSTPTLALVTARIQRSRGDREAGLATLTAALRAHPDSLLLWTERAHWTIQTDPDSAFADARRAAALPTATADTFWLLANLLDRRGEHDAAIETQRQALAIGGPDPRRRSSLGTFLDHAGRHQEALEVFRKLAAEHPDDLGHALHTGRQLFELERYPEAWEVWERLVARHPGDARLHRNRAATLAMLDDGAGLVAEFRRYAALAPDDRERQAALADVLLEQPRADRFDADAAVDAAERAMPSEPSATDWLRLARALRGAGDADAAVAAARRGLQATPDAATAARLRKLAAER